MHADFWHERWRTECIAFHRPLVNEKLEQYWQRVNVSYTARVFVLLCGKSLDMLWLLAREHRVVGAELSDIAIQAFCMENGMDARRRATSTGDYYETTHLELYRGNIFDLTPKTLGNIDAVYDRAALISWAPELRSRYVEQMAKLTQPAAKTLLVTLEYPQSSFTGPPFSIMADEIAQLCAKNHRVQIIARRDVSDIEARMRRQGISQLSEVCYRITRHD